VDNFNQEKYNKTLKSFRIDMTTDKAFQLNISINRHNIRYAYTK